MSKEFKVGDRVKLTDDLNQIEGFCKSFAGRNGVIIDKDHSSLPYRVRFDDDDDAEEDWGRDGLSLIEDDSVEPETLKAKLDAIDKLVSEVRAMIG